MMPINPSRILLGIGVGLSIAAVVSIYFTSVETGIQLSSPAQQLTSPSSSSTVGSSEPTASNAANTRLAYAASTGLAQPTNAGTTTTTTTITTTTTSANNSGAPTTTTTPKESSNLTPPTNRTFYLENTEISTINQTRLGIPPDVFSLTQIAAEKGDNISINFYDLEDIGGDNHSFTLIDGPYNIDKVLAPQQNGTINFKADQAGVFQYFCKFHAPSMTGQLVVLPKVASQSQSDIQQQQQQQQQVPSSAPSTSTSSPSSVSASITIPQGASAQQVKTYFLPNPSTVTANSQVTWNNKDIAQHTATATDGSFDTGIINVGSSGSAIVKAQGTVPYHCTIHPWMNGVLRVNS